VIHLDPARRDEAIAAGWLAYAERVPGYYGAYLNYCDAWQLVAVCSDGEVIGALFVKDGEIHVGIVPEWRGRWASRRVIREMLSYGTATTLMDSEDECKRFIGRIGFKPVGEGKYEYRR
jgi:GNAT superfamily N-acetyltransferase